ncbi:MAG: GYDIA family GHMP kinase [Flavobacterium sp.]
MKTFYSNGKLLITGEYVVLDGAKSLALPTKFGQYLHIEEGSNKEIYWKSFDSDGSIWFETKLFFSEISNNTHQENQPIRNTLIEILHEAFLLNPDFLNKTEGYIVTTKLTFPRNWGLGTSSTLINNIAQWLQIDAFTLLKNSFGGSGYDIACAQNNNPILYQLKNGNTIVTPISFEPEFTRNIYFVYLNQKQNSKEGISAYRNKKADLSKIIPEIDSITNKIINADNLETFVNELNKHETIISQLLEIKTAKEMLFPDFNGTLKSLGAWGGDFVMAVSEENPTTYFKEKGYETVLAYKDLIL